MMPHIEFPALMDLHPCGGEASYKEGYNYGGASNDHSHVVGIQRSEHFSSSTERDEQTRNTDQTSYSRTLTTGNKPYQ